MQNTKVVNLRHMRWQFNKREQSLHCSLVDTSLWTTPPEKVMLSTSLGPMTSSGLQTSRQSSIGTIIFLPPSMRRLSKPSGECWNHSQSAKKLEVKLTQSKIRYLPEGQSQLSGAITSTYKSLLVVDTSNSAWTQVNSELPKDLRHK